MAINLIELAVNKAEMTQAGIARKLGVSKTQVSKWNAGERIPYDREDQLLEMIGMSRAEAAWIFFAKDSKEIASWVHYLTELQSDTDEFKFLEALGLIENEQVSHVMECLHDFSIKIPPAPPLEDFKDWEFSDFSSIVAGSLERAGRLAFWIQEHIVGDDSYEFGVLKTELEFCSFGLALSHIDTEEYKDSIDDLSQFREKRFEVQSLARRHLTAFCDLLKEKGLPIRENYFEILSDPPESIVDEDDIYEMPFSNIAKYYSQAEKSILEEMGRLTEILYELHYKVDSLLTDDMKKRLDGEIKITKPFFPPQRPT